MTDADHITVVRLDGELEIGRKDEIRDALAEADGAGSVLVDLSRVTYADSIALTELLRFCAGSEQKGHPVALVIATPQFARLVQYAGLADAFTIFDNVSEAETYLRSGGAE
jgi:anti-anti-sigma factor